MNLSLSEEQHLLKESVARFVRDHHGAEPRRRMRETGLGFSMENWRRFAELGWLALPFAEGDGGLGGSMLDVMVLTEELGRALAPEPYLSNVCVCGAFLAEASAALRSRHLPALMTGETQWAFAHAAGNGRFDLARAGFRAQESADGFVIDGECIAVPNGHCAEFLIVSARSAGEEGETQGLSLFVVPGVGAGVERLAYPLVDGTRGADIRLRQVRVAADAMIGDPGAALELMERVLAQAIVAIGAESLGAMDALLDQTVAYARTREQFGQPIGKFQALQHRMADMYLQVQSVRSLLYYAAIARVEKRTDANRAASALKVKCGEAGRFVSQQAVQLHGGMGMTDELAIGHYFKRLLLLNTLYGDSRDHLRRYVNAA